MIGLEGTLSVLRAILYFVITIFILVTIHEFGHFIAGRIFGMRVPVFSVGMGRRIFGFNKLNKFTFGPLNPETEIKLENNTDYRLSLLPIGGYAKIEGMIDETTNEALPLEMQPWEFRAKPWWQKSIVISAGVIMNTLLAWLIFSGHNYTLGEDIRLTTTVGYVESGSLSKKLGVQAGDKIVAVDGKPVANWEDIRKAVLLDRIGRDYVLTVERDGKTFMAAYDTKNLNSPDSLTDAFGLTPIGYSNPPIEEVPAASPKSPAQLAGLKAGDMITRIQGDSIVSWYSLVDHIHSSVGKPLPFEWRRGTQVMTATITPDAQGTIGIKPSDFDYVGQKQHIDYGVGKSLALGWSDLTNNASLTFRMLGMVITGKLPVGKALGGPLKIAQMASRSASYGLESFLLFMGLLSMSLALINILPIPALDGGHLLIILVEAAIGHELSQGFKLGFQKVGVAILLSLMAFMLFSDIRSMI